MSRMRSAATNLRCSWHVLMLPRATKLVGSGQSKRVERRHVAVDANGEPPFFRQSFFRLECFQRYLAVFRKFVKLWKSNEKVYGLLRWKGLMFEAIWNWPQNCRRSLESLESRVEKEKTWVKRFFDEKGFVRFRHDNGISPSNRCQMKIGFNLYTNEIFLVKFKREKLLK